MKKVFLIMVLTLIFVGCAKETQLDTNSGLIKKQNQENNLSWLKDKTNVTKCEYNDLVVYYILSPCCDQMNYLYDSEGNKICAPDGGFSGDGDGECSDFSLDDESCEKIN